MLKCHHFIVDFADEAVVCADLALVDVVKESLKAARHLAAASCVQYYYIRVIPKWQGFLRVHALEKVEGLVSAKGVELADKDYVAWVERSVFGAFFQVSDIQGGAAPGKSAREAPCTAARLP